MEQFLNGILVVVFFITLTFFILYIQTINFEEKVEEPIKTLSDIGNGNDDNNNDTDNNDDNQLSNNSNLSSFNSFFNINYTNPPEMIRNLDLTNSNILNSTMNVENPNSNLLEDITIDDEDYITFSDLVRNTSTLNDTNSNAKCCFMNKYSCDKETGYCKSGVEKRCGVYSDLLCSQTTHLCRVLDEKQCKSKENKEHCVFKNQSCQNAVNPFDAYEISCANYERFKRLGDFEFITEHNCQEKLVI
jgi:hypothetical protein